MLIYAIVQKFKDSKIVFPVFERRLLYKGCIYVIKKFCKNSDILKYKYFYFIGLKKKNSIYLKTETIHNIIPFFTVPFDQFNVYLQN